MIGFNNTFFANIKKKSKFYSKMERFILNLKNKYETHDY